VWSTVLNFQKLEKIDSKIPVFKSVIWGNPFSATVIIKKYALKRLKALKFLKIMLWYERASECNPQWHQQSVARAKPGALEKHLAKISKMRLMTTALRFCKLHRNRTKAIAGFSNPDHRYVVHTYDVAVRCLSSY
jgi:hypothetical protein